MGGIVHKQRDQKNNGLQAIRHRLSLVMLFCVFAILASIKATLLGIFPA